MCPRVRCSQLRLREVQLAREGLQLLFGDLASVGEDRERVPGERRVREHVRQHVAEGGHEAERTESSSAKG
jgi:hypothetical protein